MYMSMASIERELNVWMEKVFDRSENKYYQFNRDEDQHILCTFYVMQGEYNFYHWGKNKEGKVLPDLGG